MNDILTRALKTFAQAFGGVLIPELCLIFSGALPQDLEAWKAVLVPIVVSAIAAGISAGWNAILQSKKTE